MSRAKAINDMCKQCIYDPQHGNGTWRQQTEACTSNQCPLWPYRPTPRMENSNKTGQISAIQAPEVAERMAKARAAKNSRKRASNDVE